MHMRPSMRFKAHEQTRMNLEISTSLTGRGKPQRTVRVRHAAAVVGNVDAADDERVAWLQPVQVPAMTDPEGERGGCSDLRGGSRSQEGPSRGSPLGTHCWPWHHRGTGLRTKWIRPAQTAESHAPSTQAPLSCTVP